MFLNFAFMCLISTSYLSNTGPSYVRFTEKVQAPVSVLFDNSSGRFTEKVQAPVSVLLDVNFCYRKIYRKGAGTCFRTC